MPDYLPEDSGADKTDDKVYTIAHTALYCDSYIVKEFVTVLSHEDLLWPDSLFSAHLH